MKMLQDAAPQKCPVLGVPVASMNLDAARGLVGDWITSRKKRCILPRDNPRNNGDQKKL